jgi:hypothetical protein
MNAYQLASAAPLSEIPGEYPTAAFGHRDDDMW